MILIDFVTDAYRLAGIISEIASPSAEQGQKAVTRCNDMFAELAEDGIDLGYGPKTDTADTLILPLGLVNGLKNMLAAKLCAEEGFAVPQQVAIDAQAGMDRMLRQVILMQNTPLALNTVSHGQGSGVAYNILTDA